MSPSDPHNLQRFLDAQHGLIDTVERELTQGVKRTHWMWFFFPQLAGLGRSETARFYALGSREEARAYAAHCVLGPRLAHCVALAVASPARTALDLFGEPDNLKFHSCLTLFAEAAPDPTPFEEALLRFFGGERDAATLRLLETAPHPV